MCGPSSDVLWWWADVSGINTPGLWQTSHLGGVDRQTSAP